MDDGDGDGAGAGDDEEEEEEAAAAAAGILHGGAGLMQMDGGENCCALASIGFHCGPLLTI